MPLKSKVAAFFLAGYVVAVAQISRSEDSLSNLVDGLGRSPLVSTTIGSFTLTLSSLQGESTQSEQLFIAIDGDCITNVWLDSKTLRGSMSLCADVFHEFFQTASAVTFPRSELNRNPRTFLSQKYLGIVPVAFCGLGIGSHQDPVRDLRQIADFAKNVLTENETEHGFSYKRFEIVDIYSLPKTLPADCFVGDDFRTELCKQLHPELEFYTTETIQTFWFALDQGLLLKRRRLNQISLDSMGKKTCSTVLDLVNELSNDDESGLWYPSISTTTHTLDGKNVVMDKVEVLEARFVRPAPNSFGIESFRLPKGQAVVQWLEDGSEKVSNWDGKQLVARVEQDNDHIQNALGRTWIITILNLGSLLTLGAFLIRRWMIARTSRGLRRDS